MDYDIHDLLLLLDDYTHRQTIKNISASIVYHYLVIITGVSHKKYRKTLGKRAKRHPFLYYYDQDGVFRSKRISKIEAFFRKFQKKKRFRFVCPTCNRSFQAFNHKRKEVKCPYCD